MSICHASLGHARRVAHALAFCQSSPSDSIERLGLRLAHLVQSPSFIEETGPEMRSDWRKVAQHIRGRPKARTVFSVSAQDSSHNADIPQSLIHLYQHYLLLKTQTPRATSEWLNRNQHGCKPSFLSPQFLQLFLLRVGILRLHIAWWTVHLTDCLLLLLMGAH